jgi:hypothetical protein
VAFLGCPAEALLAADFIETVSGSSQKASTTYGEPAWEWRMIPSLAD